MNIGTVIKQKREARNISQTELAARLHVTPQAVSRWEMGISYPDIAMVPLISEALWVSADELLGIPKTGISSGQNNYNAVLNQSQADSIFDYVPCAATDGSKRILVIDDADFMRSTLKNILTEQGHAVLQAQNGQEGLDILQHETVDVCILDIVMPVMDGITALKKIKDQWPDIKVVMLSAMSQESNIRLALELGADAFIVKPFQPGCLLERI